MRINMETIAREKAFEKKANAIPLALDGGLR